VPTATPLWSPSAERQARSNMARFQAEVNARRGLALADYPALHRWSVEHLADFWADFWGFAAPLHSAGYTRAVDDPRKLPGARWFEGARLNFAENLLRFRDDRPALVFHGEGGDRRELSYAQLAALVARLAASLKALGVGPGDRVVGYLPNLPETVVAMLAATSLGATWSSTSPDFGAKGVLDRFGQVAPRVLFVADGVRYGGKVHDSLERVREIVSQIPSVERVVVIPYVSERPDVSAIPNAVVWGDFLAPGAPALEFTQVPFDHPLYIMYSSGTTGLPKCLVQSVGGILVNHLKEHVLHTDLTRDDRIFYFTTCGWMMWNWLVSALAVGATVVLFDGSPFHPGPARLWSLAEAERVTIFGVSAKYLAVVEKEGYRPREHHDLSAMRTILSTGSPLAPESFDFVYRDVKADVQLSSIAGGTDLNGCFVLGSPSLPVYRGEIQGQALGMDMAAFDADGQPVVGREGELVCRQAFPSAPIGFWNDPTGERYRDAYFRAFPGVWHHGDFVVFTETGGIVMLGRSDATLNPGGVRIGTAELYRQVETLPEIEDSVVIGQDWDNDVRVVLFVKLRPGVALTDELKSRIKKTIREGASARHVPAKILPVADIPYTLSMKKVELAVRNVIHGRPVTNRSALRNPESLELYKDLPELKS